MIATTTEFQKRFDVSRETIERLTIYNALLEKWNTAINLVSKPTLKDIWGRHFTDSAMVFGLTTGKGSRWVDFGSGGGFPGIVVAILAHEKRNDASLACIEADQRKAEFLRTVIRETGIDVSVIAKRIEDAPSQSADLAFSRALAPLDRLLTLVSPHLSGGATCVFHKGRGWKEELDAAREQWNFHANTHKSITEPNAVLLEIGDLERA